MSAKRWKRSTISAAPRARATRMKVIAVTGSGCWHQGGPPLALAPSGSVHASAKSYNNHWGVPLSLARCPASARHAVFEIGMNHAGEIAPLSRLVRPHAAIITTVEPVHLEFFRSVEEIADAKAEIFVGIEPTGAAIVNRDNPQFARLQRQAKAAGVSHIVGFGSHARADARLIKTVLQGDCSEVASTFSVRV